MSAARSVLVDGRPVARIGGTAVSVTPCADGLHSFVLTRVDAQVVELWRFRHEDGAVERLIADMPVQERHRERVVVAQAAPRVFVCGEYGGAIRWYAPGGVAGVVPGGRRGLLCACSPDGERLAIVCEPEHDATRGDRPAPVGRVVDVDTGALRLEWTGGAVGAFALLDDGGAVAYVDAAKTSLVVASLVDGSSRAIGLRAPVEPRRVLAERGGGRVAVVAAPCEVIVCDPTAARVVTRFWAEDKAECVGFAAGRLVTQERVSGGTRRVVRDVDAGDEEELGGDVRAVGPLTPDGRWMVRHAAPIVELVDLRDGRARRLHDGHEGLVHDAAWSADGALLATLAVSGAVRVWDVGAAELLWEFEAAARAVYALAFSPDRTHLYGVGSSFVAWGLDDGAERQRVALPGGDQALMPRCRVAVSPDGQRLLTNATWALVMVEQPAHAAQVRRQGYGHGNLGYLAFDGPTRYRTLAAHDAWPARGVDAWWYDLSSVQVAESHRGSEWSSFVAVDGDARAAVGLHQGDLVRIDLRDEASRAVLMADAGLRRVVAAAGELAVVERAGGSLAAIDLLDGRERAALPLERRFERAVVAPTGAHVAVVYGDGGVEVFALPER